MIRRHVVTGVEPNSLAASHDIAPGDVLLRINEREIQDVFDYRYLIQKMCVTLDILKASGQEERYAIHKNAGSDLGLIFERDLMDEPKRCANRCLFCFIDQLPENMRRTLYFKDDDARLSFLTGNYVTFTNTDMKDIERLAFYHLSPINISVHATDPKLRAKLLGRREPTPILPIIKLLSDAGISLNFQVVLCKNINDGLHLDRTIRELSLFRPKAVSLSVVPAGMTQFRIDLPALAPFTLADAAAVVDQVEGWQNQFLQSDQSRFVYAADEFYLQARRKLPPYASYDDFPQLDNGVGMLALFNKQCVKAIQKLKSHKPGKLHLSVVTARAAYAFMSAQANRIMKAFPAIRLDIHVIENDFFGKDITVSGLLTGADIQKQLAGKDLGARLLIPANALRKDIFLDDMSITDLSVGLSAAVKAVPTNGAAFVNEVLI